MSTLVDNHETITTVPFTAFDRCDRCQAQAYVEYELKGMNLMFCIHHSRKHEEGLITSGARVVRDNSGNLDGENRLVGNHN